MYLSEIPLTFSGGLCMGESVSCLFYSFYFFSFLFGLKEIQHDETRSEMCRTVFNLTMCSFSINRIVPS